MLQSLRRKLETNELIVWHWLWVLASAIIWRLSGWHRSKFEDVIIFLQRLRVLVICNLSGPQFSKRYGGGHFYSGPHFCNSTHQGTCTFIKLAFLQIHITWKAQNYTLLSCLRCTLLGVLYPPRHGLDRLCTGLVNLKTALSLGHIVFVAQPKNSSLSAFFNPSRGAEGQH